MSSTVQRGNGMTMEVRKCRQCGSEFVCTNRKRVFCHKACSTRSRYQKRIRSSRTCMTCGSVFQPERLGQPPKYCSRRCKIRMMYKRNPAPILARNRRWTRAHWEASLKQQAAWRRRNLEVGRRKENHRRARVRNAGGSYTREEWINVLTLWSNTCAYCGMGGRITVDHRTPISRGGSNDISNILPACKTCNSQKHTQTETEYRAARIAAIRTAAA